MSALRTKLIGLSIREFAKSDQCDEKLVRRHIQRGSLKTFSDGTLDPGLVGTGWRETNRRRPKGADTVRTVRTKVSAVSALVPVSAPAPPPDQVCTLAAVIDGAAQDVAVLLLQLGQSRADVERHVDGWLAQVRHGAAECVREDMDLPAGLSSWDEHAVFTAPWLEGTDWAELEARAADEQGTHP